MSKILTESIFTVLRKQIGELSSLKYDIDYRFDELCIDQCPEDYFYAESMESATKLTITRDKTSRAVSYDVEYPTHIDGEFVTLKCDNLPEGIRAFEFAHRLIKSIRASVNNSF